MDYDHKLTIVLLLKGRIQFTQRWMSYAEKIQLPFKVLIADGSSDDKAKDLLSDKGVFPNVDYEYLRYPYDETLPHYYAKVVDVLSRVTTPYVALACNDDFYVISGIRKALAFLESNSDYVSARGEIYQCMIRPIGSDKDIQYVYGPLIVTNPPYFRAPSIIGNTPLLRVEQQLQYFCRSNFLDIQRISDVMERFKLIQKLDPRDLRFTDLMNDILTAAHGKIHRGVGLFMLYQSNAPENEGQKVLNEFPTCFDWMQTSWWHEDFKNMVEAVAKAIAKGPGMFFDEACRQFKKSFLVKFYGPRFLDDLKQPERLKKRKQTDMVVGYVKKTGFAYYFMRSIYSRICTLKDYTGLVFSGYFIEINKIRDFVSAPKCTLKNSSVDMANNGGRVMTILRGQAKRIGLIKSLSAQICLRQMLKHPRISNMVIYANSFCNAACKMCDVGVSSEDGMSRAIKGTPKYLPLPLLERVLDDEFVAGKRIYINFAMTEPLLTPDLPSMLSLCKQKGHTVKVTTNGLLLPKRAGDIVPYVDNVQVSIDGPKKIHDSIRGEGFFAAATEGIKVLRQMSDSVEIEVNYTISNLNYFCLLEFLNAIESLRVPIDILKFQCMDFISGSMINRHNSSIPSIQQTMSTCNDAVDVTKVDPEELYKQLKLIHKAGPSFIRKVVFKPPIKTPEELKQYFNPDGNILPQWNKCFGPWNAIAINTAGKVFWMSRCFNDYILGDVNYERLRDIFLGKRSAYFRALFLKHNFCFPACSRCCGVMPIE